MLKTQYSFAQIIKYVLKCIFHLAASFNQVSPFETNVAKSPTQYVGATLQKVIKKEESQNVFMVNIVQKIKS